MPIVPRADFNHPHRLALTSSRFFPQAVRSLGDVPGMVKADLDPLLRRFDTAGDGRISLSALMHWAGRSFLPCAGVENVVSWRLETLLCQLMCCFEHIPE